MLQNVWNVVLNYIINVFTPPPFFSPPEYKSSDLLSVPRCQWCIMSRLPPTLSPAANLQPSLTFGLIKGNSSLPNWWSLLFQPWRKWSQEKTWGGGGGVGVVWQTDGFGNCWLIVHLSLLLFLNASSWMLLKSPLIQTCCLSQGRRGNVCHTEWQSSSNSS